MSDFSPLTNREMRTSKSSPRPAGQRITRVIAHHHGTTGNGGVERLVNSTDEASSNYIIMNSGELIGSVPESRRAWTSGSPAADNPAITVEIQNETGAPEWRISDAAIATFTRLLADVADRHEWGPLAASHLRGHREFQATDCPGPYLWPRLAGIRAEAQKARGGNPTPPAGGGGATPRTGTVPRTDVIVTADGVLGPYTVRALQQRLREMQYRNHAVDGDFGPYTVRSLQAFLRKRGQAGHAIDGDFGPYSIRSLQSWLRVRGYSAHAIDGDFGRYTITSLQNCLLDGKFTATP